MFFSSLYSATIFHSLTIKQALWMYDFLIGKLVVSMIFWSKFDMKRSNCINEIPVCLFFAHQTDSAKPSINGLVLPESLWYSGSIHKMAFSKKRLFLTL